MNSAEKSRVTGQVYKAIYNYHKAKYTKTVTYQELLKCDDKEAMREKIRNPDISIFPVSNLVVINPFTPIEYTIKFSYLKKVQPQLELYKQNQIDEILKNITNDL